MRIRACSSSRASWQEDEKEAQRYFTAKVTKSQRGIAAINGDLTARLFDFIAVRFAKREINSANFVLLCLGISRLAQIFEGEREVDGQKDYFFKRASNPPKIIPS